jgi:hypothetical protein
MKKEICLTALASSALTLLAAWSLGGAALPSRIKLENAKVRVREVTYPPGTPRERHIRATDQVIVFLDECRYERLDSTTQEKVRAAAQGRRGHLAR